MRDVLIARVQPMIEDLTEDLVDLVMRKVETEVERIGEAFAIALSAYASGDVLARALGPELAAMTPKKKVVHRDVKPPNYPQSRRAREERTALQANGKKPVTCQKCGFVGGNQRGCGKAHPTQTRTGPRTVPDAPRRSAGAVEAVNEDRLERAPRVSSKAPRSGQPPTLGMRGSVPRASATVRAPKEEPNDLERWPASRIADETRRAEASKHAGELPVPSITFEIGGRRGF